MSYQSPWRKNDQKSKHVVESRQGRRPSQGTREPREPSEMVVACWCYSRPPLRSQLQLRWRGGAKAGGGWGGAAPERLHRPGCCALGGCPAGRRCCQCRPVPHCRARSAGGCEGVAGCWRDWRACCRFHSGGGGGGGERDSRPGARQTRHLRRLQQLTASAACPHLQHRRAGRCGRGPPQLRCRGPVLQGPPGAQLAGRPRLLSAAACRPVSLPPRRRSACLARLHSDAHSSVTACSPKTSNACGNAFCPAVLQSFVSTAGLNAPMQGLTGSEKQTAQELQCAHVSGVMH